MRLLEIQFHDFRNYESLKLGDLGDLVILSGPNGVGKTNILEGIHLLTAVTSFRNAQINQLIRQGSYTARINADMSDGNRLITTSLTMEAGKKRYQVNGKNKTAAQVKGTLPSVSFIPEDLDLAKKSSSVKRNSIDNLGVQLSKSYDMVHRDYEKALQYKNTLLKDEAPLSYIDAINETILTVATQLYCYRRALYSRIIPLVQENYRLISQSGEQFAAEYLPSWIRMQQRFPNRSLFSSESMQSTERDEVRTYIYDAIDCFKEEETRAHRSFIGPHNDQITFFLDGKDASVFASQGQQRTMVLAWKLAEVQLVEKMLGKYPVLLLDDVMSELDENRRDMLVNVVGSEIQTFITTTDLSSFNRKLLDRAQVVPVGM